MAALAADAAVVIGARTLQSADQVGQYFVGRWSLRRRLRYLRGGIDGRVAGVAEFARGSAERGETILYSESGELIFDEPMQQRGMPQSLSISQRYLLLCDRLPVAVHFCDSRTKQRGEFFHNLSFEEPGPDAIAAAIASTAQNRTGVDEDEVTASAEFEHLCGDDLYCGKLLVLGFSRFVWRWKIDGPNKAGEIDTLYERVSN
eukprot:SAG31_NODE_1986_length_6725_cov_3.779505_5_plen_203_part_00